MYPSFEVDEMHEQQQQPQQQQQQQQQQPQQQNAPEGDFFYIENP